MKNNISLIQEQIEGLLANISGVEAIINSMTKKERRDHTILNGSRRRRIATGSGTTVADVNRVVKQYIQLRKMLKMLKGKKKVKFPKFPF